MEANKKASPDFLDLWRRSEAPKLEKKTGEKTLNESRQLWTNLSQMSPSDQAAIMTKLTGLWPYSTERRALNWPIHAGLLTSCLTTSLVATRINADMIGFDRKMPFFEAVRTLPKSPFVFSIYTSGITYFLLQQTFVTPLIYREDDPCASCILTRSAAIGIFAGIIMPMFSTPYLCYYVLSHRKEQLPVIKNMLEFLMLSIEGSKASRSLVLPLIVLQTAVTAISIYSILWARKRIFGTMDVDPELAKDLLLQVQAKPTMKEKIMDYLRILKPSDPEKADY